MRFPFPFRRENSSAARLEREEQLQKALSEGLRTLGVMFSRAADFIEKKRLERQGYDKQGRFLERTPDRTQPPR